MAWIDEKSTLFAPHLRQEDIPYTEDDITQLKEFVATRKGNIMMARENGAPPSSDALYEFYCRLNIGTVDTAYETTWNSHADNTWKESPLSVTGTINVGETVRWRAKAGVVGQLENYILEIQTTDRKWMQWSVFAPSSRFYEQVQEGVTRPMESQPFHATGYVWDMNTQTYDEEFFLDDGQISPIKLVRNNGGAVNIAFSGTMYSRIE